MQTCNGCDCSYYAHNHAHRHPKQPLMWTELWQKHEKWGKVGHSGTFYFVYVDIDHGGYEDMQTDK